MKLNKFNNSFYQKTWEKNFNLETTLHLKQTGGHYINQSKLHFEGQISPQKNTTI